MISVKSFFWLTTHIVNCFFFFKRNELSKEREFNFRPEWLRSPSTENLGPRNIQQPQRRQEQDGAHAIVSGVGVGRSHSDMVVASTRSHRQPQHPNMHDTAGRGHNLRPTGIGQAQSQPPHGQYTVRYTTAATSQWRQPRPTHTQAQPQHAPDYPPYVSINLSLIFLLEF